MKLKQNGPPSAEFVQVLRDATIEGASVHELPLEAKEELTRHRVYTTSEARHPGTRGKFHKEYEGELAQERIANRTVRLLASTPEYRGAIEEGRLAEELDSAFEGVGLHIEAEDVHFVEAKDVSLMSFLKKPRKNRKPKQGVVMARSMTLTVPDEDKRDKVATAIDASIRNSSPDYFMQVRSRVGKDGQPGTVVITNVSEYSLRTLARTLGRLVDKEIYDKMGVTLPPYKRSHADWRAAHETFDPRAERRLKKVNEVYQQMTASATYRDRPDLAPLHYETGPLGTDPFAFLQKARNILNALGDDIRGGSHLNAELHPSRADQSTAEQGERLHRDRSTRQSTAHGPANPRGATIVEQGDEGLRKMKEHAKRKPLHLAGKLAAKALGAGIEIAAEVAPHGIDYWRQRSKANKEYERRQGAAERSARKLARLANRLHRQKEGLPLWSEEL